MGKLFPRGALAAGNGDLIQITNVSIDTKNGAKQKHTIREDGVGIAFGNEETTVSFDFDVPEEGMERDYFEQVRKKKVSLLRLKIPKKTLVIDGAYSSVKIDIPQDDAVKGSCEFVGKITYSGR